MIEIILVDDKEFTISEVAEKVRGTGLRFSRVQRIKEQKPLEISPATVPNSKPKDGCCGQSKQSPSMIKKAKSYAKTMARWYKAGSPIVSLRVFADRLVVCGRCDSLKNYECTECGCPMDNKAKMGIDKLCELNKW